MSNPELFENEAPFPAHPLARACIAAVRDGRPAWLDDPAQKQARKILYCRTKVDSKERSQRWLAADAALFVMNHDDQLLRWDAALAGVSEQFRVSSELAARAVKRCEDATVQAEAASAEATGRQAQAERSHQTQHAKLHEDHRQAQARLLRLQQELDNLTHSDDTAATDKAAVAVAKARKDLEEATAALAIGPGAEVLRVRAKDADKKKSEAALAARKLAEERAAQVDAREQQLQVEIDASLVAITDRIAEAWFTFGRVGNRVAGIAPELVVAGVDERRAPLAGAGMAGFLGVLYSPNYAALEVDLSALSDGNEPRERGADAYYDEALSRSANRVQFVADAPDRPGDRRVSVTYADPSLDPNNGITRVTG